MQWESIVRLKTEITQLLDARTMEAEWELRDRERSADDLIKSWLTKNQDHFPRFTSDQLSDLMSVFALRYGYHATSQRQLRKATFRESIERIPDQLRQDSLQGIVDDLAGIQDQLVAIGERIDSFWENEEVKPGIAGRHDEVKTLVDRLTVLKTSIERVGNVMAVVGEYHDLKDEWLNLNNGVQWLDHLATKNTLS